MARPDEPLSDESFDEDPRERDQPERDDLIDPQDVSSDEVAEPTQDDVVGRLPPEDELPESQGADMLEAEAWTEEASSRRLLADEEAAIEHVENDPDGGRAAE